MIGNEKGMNEGPSSVNQDVDARLDTQTILMSWIAAMMMTGAAWLLAPILVPFVLALTLAIAISPVARRLESMGLARTLASLI